MPTAIPVDEQSFLGAYAKRGAFTDSYAVEVAPIVGLSEFIEAFHTTRLFKVERWLIAKFLGFTSSDRDVAELAVGARSDLSAWKLESRSDKEILLGFGRTRLWLAVAPCAEGSTGTRLLFGSAVVSRKPDGHFGIAFHAMGGLHKLYSKLLLGAAARRVVGGAPPRTAA